MSQLINDEASRCLTCARPMCKQGCPLANDVPTIIKYIRAKEFDKAVETIGHPFGEICGYVCSHENQCQGACVLNKKSAPVLTGTIERELFAAHPYVIQRRSSFLEGKNYAVVGGGVSGLTFAAKVYEQGANVTVFERDELLSTVKLIPEFRLPRNAVLRVEQAIKGKFNVVRDKIDGNKLKSLKAQFDGVYVSTGAMLDYGLGVDGQALATNYRECLKGNFNRGTVVIVGGGNSAMDCARYAARQGCKAIVAYRRAERDMPCFARELAQAHAENVEFMLNVAPTNLCKTDGKLRLTLARTVSEGRGKLTVTNETFTLDADSVIAAVGSKFDGSILSADKNAEQYLQYDNVYLGGDAKGGKLIVDAVKDGLNVANLLAQTRG